MQIKNGLLITILLGTSLLYGQTNEKEEKLWSVKGISSVSFSQVSLSNWSAGGEGSYSVSGIFNVYAIRKHNKSLWESGLETGYGMQKTESQGLRKTDDKLIISSKYGHELSKTVFLTGLGQFNTQFSDGFSYKIPGNKDLISAWLSPGYLMASLGIDYKPKPEISIFVSPFTGKWTFVLNDSLSNIGAFGVDTGKTVKNEFGGYLKFSYKKENIIKNVNLQTSIDFFSNYLKNPQNIDVRWELLVLMKVNKLLTASVSTTLVYDDDIKLPGKSYAGTQFQEIVGVGLSYSF